MDSVTIYQDIAKRTNGDIYIGVVGPVRSGKSTFIKKFMDELVLPNIEDENEKTRVVDELPQSATGKAVMTTQPQFVPDKGVKIDLEDNLNVNIRLIDCVGYMVNGVENQDRMVNSPWFAHEIPFAEAGEIGTKKVMCDHSTIGIVVTTDGSVTDFARADYEQSEERIIADMKKTGKPFIILLNTNQPDSSETQNMVAELTVKYGVTVIAKNVSNMVIKDIQDLLSSILGEFPLRMIGVNLPKWMQMLSFDSELISKIMKALAEKIAFINKMCDYTKLKEIFADDADFNNIDNISVHFDDGSLAV
ncbi:MAG TPA: 50S ribosome-binding GTPase, partial [Clostridia bacterium]|nr:50S ribosome-binding GTPase [Clostridia bacterium]